MSLVKKLVKTEYLYEKLNREWRTSLFTLRSKGKDINTVEGHIDAISKAELYFAVAGIRITITRKEDAAYNYYACKLYRIGKDYYENKSQYRCVKLFYALQDLLQKEAPASFDYVYKISDNTNYSLWYKLDNKAGVGEISLINILFVVFGSSILNWSLLGIFILVNYLWDLSIPISLYNGYMSALLIIVWNYGRRYRNGKDGLEDLRLSWFELTVLELERKKISREYKEEIVEGSLSLIAEKNIELEEILDGIDRKTVRTTKDRSWR
jgi:hypothetical protein